MAKRKIINKTLDQPVTMRRLGQFTEDVILPGVEVIVSGLETKVASLETRIGSLDTKVESIREDIIEATKRDMKATEVRILQAVDKIATAFDKAEKDQAADKLLHDRHERRLEKLEAKGLK
jgi:outer membrane murein-binding lipoprotein Lpp